MASSPPKFALATDGTVQDPYKPYAVFVVHFEAPVFIASVDAGVASPPSNTRANAAASTVRLIPVFVEGLEPGSTEIAAATHGLFHEAARFFAQTARIASYADAPPLVVWHDQHPFIPDHLVALQPLALPAPSPARQAGIGLVPADIVVRVLPPVFWLHVPAGFTEDSDFNSIPQHFIAPSDAQHPKASDFLGDALYFYLDLMRSRGSLPAAR
jgi:hypothetical protein